MNTDVLQEETEGTEADFFNRECDANAGESLTADDADSTDLTQRRKGRKSRKL